ncbi:hypothetical protein LINPERHAP2_LOCUS22190 [Linum perenne]
MSNSLRFARADKSGNLVIEVQSVMLSDLKVSNLSRIMTSANCVHFLILSFCSLVKFARLIGSFSSTQQSLSLSVFK